MKLQREWVLKVTRGVSFEEVQKAIQSGDLLDDIAHFNQKHYPNQRIFIIQIKHDIYAVPYVTDKRRNTVFLKTIYPNRVLTKKYMKGETNEKETK